MRSLVRSLFLYYKIETTVEKAKEARRLAEGLITLSKKATLANIRAIDSILQDRALTRKLIQQISPVFKPRNSGYTRVVRSGFRKGDGAPLAVLELTEKPTVEKKPKKEKKQRPPSPEEEKPRPKKEKLPAEGPPAKEKKELSKKEISPPQAEKRPPVVTPREKEKPEGKPKPREEKLAPEKKSLFEKLKGFFKK